MELQLEIADVSSLYVALITIYSVILVFLQLLENRQETMTTNFINQVAVLQQRVYRKIDDSKSYSSIHQTKLDFLNGVINDARKINARELNGVSVRPSILFIVRLHRIVYGTLYRFLLLKDTRSLSADYPSITDVVAIQLFIVMLTFSVNIFLFFVQSKLASYLYNFSWLFVLTITFTILVLLIEQLRAEHLKAYFGKQTSRLMSILIDDD